MVPVMLLPYHYGRAAYQRDTAVRERKRPVKIGYARVSTNDQTAGLEASWSNWAR
jgi:predicted site-specific integrase-resolvase